MLPTVEDDGSGENPLAHHVPVDGWVAYHGTSSVFADRIERAGLSPDNGLWTAEDSRATCEVFEKLQWYGLTNGGYVVLGTWGPGRDLSITGRRHIYLAETYTHASGYAHAPAGETSEALLKSLDDLRRFQTDALVRQEHITQLRTKLYKMSNLGGRSQARGRTPSSQHSPVEEVASAIRLAENVEWLEVHNQRFDSLRERLNQATLDHRPVVYAVLLDKSTLRGGFFSSSMGIEVSRPIPPGKIVAKAFPVAQRKSDREISRDSPPGRFDALMKLWATWESRLEEANA